MKGRAVTVKHYGSVDIFLEAIARASAGEILVVDNAGRLDEGCIGDLITLEAKLAGIAAIVLWGAHRDSGQLPEIGLPMFSLGSIPTGPSRLDARGTDAFQRAQLGEATVFPGDLVVADADGVIVVDWDNSSRVLELAAQIQKTEISQAAKMRAGISLRSQLQFDEYLAQRQRSAGYTFRMHLQKSGGAVET